MNSKILSIHSPISPSLILKKNLRFGKLWNFSIPLLMILTLIPTFDTSLTHSQVTNGTNGASTDVTDSILHDRNNYLGEPDCPFIDAYWSKRNTRLFWIYSRWRDEAAFDIHAELPNTLSFIRKMRS